MVDEAATRRVVEQLYDAYLGGDPAGMLTLMAEDVHVRFLGQSSLHGIEETRRFFDFAAGLLTDLDFRIDRRIVDGEWAAVTWSETARTAAGEPWENHGVDVIRVVEGEIVVLHENNDVRQVHRHFPRYENQAANGR
ncbi:MAG: nuclear transport factor 2 family protein [Acidimicrobiia bacterium]